MSANWFSVSKATLIDILTKLTAVFDTKADASHSHTKNDITDFPTLGTAAAKDAPSSGNATSSQVVMGNDTRLSDSRPASDVSAWAKAASKPTYTASEVGAIASTLKGANNGVAELDSNGKVPSSQLPSYVDDVIEGYYNSSTDRFYEESTFTTVIPPESGKSWVDIPSNKSYRWTGSVYTRVDEGVQLGETSSTAYRGDRGKIAYDHSQLTSGNPHNVTKSDVGLGNVGNFKAVSTAASQGLTDTEKSNARANIGAGTSSFSGSYNDLSNIPSTFPPSAHTHPLSIATDSGTSALDMAANTIYKLTAGGKTFIFKTPADNDHYAWADISGKPSSYPPSAHTHTVNQITDFPSTMPPSSHTHGNIQNGGTLQTNDVAIANGDKLVITDSSDSSKIARASIAFDGSTATKCLTQKGTWENFTNNAGTVTSVKVGSTSYSPSNGVVSLPAYPTTLPASDVYAWAKASNKPSYAWSEITDKPSSYTPSAHNHGTLHSDFTKTVTNTTTDSGWSMINDTYSGFLLKSLRMNANTPNWLLGNYSAGICFGGSDTKGVISVSYDAPRVRFAGGNGTKPVWYIGIEGVSGNVYKLQNFLTSHQDISGKLNKSGDTMTGTLRLGSSNQSTMPTCGLYVHDIRNATVNVDSFSKAVNFLFDDSSLTNYMWQASMLVRGWNGNYNAWELAGPASDTDQRTLPLYVRTSKQATWGNWRKIYDSSNPPTASEVGAKPIKSQISRNTITNGYWVKLFSANYNSYNFLGIDMIAYRGYGDSIRAKLLMRFTPSGFLESDSRVVVYGYAFDSSDPSNVIRITKDNSTTFSVWVQVNGTNSRYGYDILAISDEANAFFDGTNFVAARWSFPTTFETSSNAPTNVIANKSYLTSVSWSDVTDKPSTYTPASHAHGNIQNGGTLQTNDITIANGDKLVVTDSSDSSKIARASISFDGSTATKCLTQKGTWETFASSNTDTKVTQTATTTNANYEVLFSETADNTTRTEGARKTSTLSYNPNKKIFKVSGSVKAEVIKAFNSAKLNTTTDTWAFNVADYNEATVFGVHFKGNTAIAELGNSFYGEGYKARGYLRIYGGNTAYTSLSSNVSTTNRDINFPDKSGTIALTSDIPNVPDFTLTAMKTITKVNNAYYTFNGTNGVHYGYYKYGRIVVAVWNVYCPATATEAATQKIGSGFPKPANGVGLSFALGSQNLNRGAAIGIIDSNGDAFAMGGCNTNGSYYYGVCTYIT